MFLVPFETAYTTPINVKRFSNQGRGKRFQPTGAGGFKSEIGAILVNNEVLRKSNQSIW